MLLQGNKLATVANSKTRLINPPALLPIGILVGPMVVALLQTMLRMLRRELSQLDDHQTDLALASATELTTKNRTEDAVEKDAANAADVAAFVYNPRAVPHDKLATMFDAPCGTVQLPRPFRRLLQACD